MNANNTNTAAVLGTVPDLLYLALGVENSPETIKPLAWDSFQDTGGFTAGTDVWYSVKQKGEEAPDIFKVRFVGPVEDIAVSQALAFERRIGLGEYDLPVMVTTSDLMEVV